MKQFTLSLDLNSSFLADAPGLEILLDDQIVSYASLTGTGQTLSFDISYSGSALPSSFSFRFQNDASSESARSISIQAVRINAQPVDNSHLTQLILQQNETTNVDTAATAPLFSTTSPNGIDPNAPPTDAELGTATHSGTANGEVLNATTGDDVILGYGGNDIMRGYDGNDALSLGDGDDKGYGGAGNDIITGGAGIDRLYGEDGNDTLFGEDGADRLYGGDGDDFISGGNDNDWALAGAGNDTLHGGEGDDLFYGGDNNDTLQGDAGADKLYGDAGDDTLTGGEGDDRLYGGNDNDHISGDAGADRLYGSQGNDTVLGGEGDDFVYGGTQNDTLFGGEGNDRVYGQEDDDILNGEAGDDRLYGGTGQDILNGGGGADNVYGNEGNDTAYGGEGNDRIYGDEGNDVLSGGAGTDRIYGGADNDTIDGGADGDFIYAGIGDDTAHGGEGDDRIYGDTGNDTIHGDEGSDRLYADEGDDIIDGGADDDFIYAGTGDDTAHGGTGNDRIYGNTGNDTLYGDDGVDRLYGDDGDDHIEGGNGNDFLYAGDGNDTIYGQEGTDRIIAGAGDDTVYGGTEKDILYGNEGNDTIHGEDGDDWISGNDGNDTIHGGAGKDTIYGYHDNDIVNGDDGNDFINGGLGNDTINGGNDNDFLVGNTGADVINGDAGDDTIYALNFVEDIQARTLTDQITDNDPVAYWKFDETGGTIVQNYGSAIGVNATIKQGLTLGSTAINKPNGVAAKFDGVNDYVTIADSVDINASAVTKRTIELVFNANGTDSRQVLYEEGGATNAIVIYIDDGKIYFNARDGNGAKWGPFDISTAIEAGEDYHAAFTLDAAAGNIKGFLNGVEVGLGVIDGQLNPHSGDIGIGSMNNDSYFHDGPAKGAGFHFGGRISDVAVYNKVLTEADFLSHYEALELSADPSLNDGNDILSGGDGNDTLYASGGDDELYGDAGNDTLHGGIDSNIIEGGTGNDVLYADGYQIDAATVAAPETLSDKILNGSPIAYWDLSETSGNKADNQGTLGASVDGNIINGVTLGAAALYTNGGFSADFDGINDTIEIPDNAAINTSTQSQRTIELVFNADTVAGRQVLFEEGGSVNALNIYIDEGQLYVLGRDANDWDVFDINTSVSSGQTYHVALVMDASSGKLHGYLDGDLIGSGDITIPLSAHSGDIGIGAMNDNSYFHDGANNGNDKFNFDGKISDVALYNEALSQEDIQARADIIEGNTGSNTPIDDTLTGGDGFDQLYGGNGRDLFVFENSSIFNNVDEINDFSTADIDTLDISDILDGFSENKLDKFLELTEVGGNTILSIDTNGQVGGKDYVDVIQFNDTTGLDLQVLYDGGQIIL